jgi:hypothetical protein
MLIPTSELLHLLSLIYDSSPQIFLRLSLLVLRSSIIDLAKKSSLIMFSRFFRLPDTLEGVISAK